MLEVLITFCLASEAQTCVEKKFYPDSNNTLPYTCLYEAQTEISKYIEEHPNYVIKKWRCGPSQGQGI